MKRRSFLRDGSVALALAATMPVDLLAQETKAKIPTRPIPATGEPLPIIGFGGSATFSGDDYAAAAALLDALRDAGGKFVDTWPQAEPTLGRYAAANAAHDALFLGTNLTPGNAAANRRAISMSKARQGKEALDLIQLPRPRDLRRQWPVVRDWKLAGHARYIGIAVTGQQFFDDVETLLKGGEADFMQINYSMMEPQAGERLLPLARDEGVAVISNRPFLNGQFFSKVAGRELPAWAADFDCRSWAQFSLKWILANDIVNCAITETTKLHHAVDNLSAGVGRLPDPGERERMQAFMRTI